MDAAGEYSNVNVTGKATIDGDLGLEDFGEKVSSFCNFEDSNDLFEGCEDQFDKLGMPLKVMKFNSIEEAFSFYNRYA